MSTPKVVIGANYGDEGKGLITDYLCDKYEADMVVRFNGGAQAGHTVVTPTGERHVFSHFGSGSFTGANTYLSKFFVVNPILFFKELDSLKSTLAVRPNIYIDPRCHITTPYDMILNQLLEDHRGSSRHGSCGVGFGETIERNLNEDSSLTFKDLAFYGEVTEKINFIRKVYMPRRCRALGLNIPKDIQEMVNDPTLCTNFINTCMRLHEVTMFATPDTLSKYKQIVFEGAQGLLLDQDHGFSPHVTRSSTGLPNVLSICEENAIERLDVIYVTRCYLTRHGAGFMNNEHHPMPFVNVVDPTNVPHAYQGTIRYAPLDIDQLHKSIQRDLHNGTSHAYGPKVKLNPGLAITCLDQLVSAPDVVHKGSMQKLGTATDIGKQISDMIGFYTPPIKSYGPTRSTIQGYETLACNKAA